MSSASRHTTVAVVGLTAVALACTGCGSDRWSGAEVSATTFPRDDAPAEIVATATTHPVGDSPRVVLDAPPADVQSTCADPDKLYAPSAIPEGWKQFVLQIRPAGSCGEDPLLMLSLVEPGLDQEHPGKLATIVVQPLGLAMPVGGETVVWGDRSVTLERGASSIGPQQPISATFTESGLMIRINATGVGEEQLRQIVESIAVVDPATWQAIVDSVIVAPSV